MANHESQLPRVPGSGVRAREQADAYDSMFSSIPLELSDGSILELPPHPNLGMLDDEQQEAYEELMFEMESYDREPDIIFKEQTLPSGTIVPQEVRRGELKTPYRKDGALVKPPHRTRVVQVALGEKAYARLLEGGKGAVDVWRCWHEQMMRITERQASDSKSN
jgi:hypothetical protein